MARPASVPGLLEEFRTFLEERCVAYEQGGQAAPTLPATRGGKVNVRGLMREFHRWGEDRGVPVPATAWQYVYAERDWSGEIDVAAKAQGLAPTTATDAGTADDAAQKRIARLAKDAKDQTEGHALAKARVVRLERQLAERDAEIKRLRKRFSLMQRTGAILRTGDVIE